MAATAAAVRPRWNATLDGYLRACQGNDTAAINVTRWMGRVGNRLWQLQTALVVAQASGRKYLELPGDLDQRVLALPRRLPVLFNNNKPITINTTKLNKQLLKETNQTNKTTKTHNTT